MWKNVPGYLNEVTDDGRVRSIKRIVVRKNGSPHTVESQELQPWLANGYKMVRVYRENGSFTDVGVHRLVLLAFRGLCPLGMEACHNDGNRQNNLLGNLRWDIHKHNMVDRDTHGRQARGSKCVKAKLTEVDIPIIRSLKSERWGAMSETARLYKVDVATIRDIWIGKTWKHVK